MKRLSKSFRSLVGLCLVALSTTSLNAQQPKWVLPDYLWNMQSTTLSSTTLPTTYGLPYRLSNGAYNKSGSLLFYIYNDEIKNLSGTTVGTLLPYYMDLVRYNPDVNPVAHDSKDFEATGEEVAIVPVPGSCKKFYVIYTKGNHSSPSSFVCYAVVDCSGASVTVSYPLANNPGVSNAPISLDAGIGLAVSKTFNGSDRYLFTESHSKLLRYTITSSGISSQTTICDGTSDPSLFPVSGSGYYKGPELELSPDQQYLAWGNTRSGKMNMIKLNASYTKVSGSAVTYTLADIRGLEFNSASTKIYLSHAAGLSCYTISSGTATSVTGGSALNNTFLELSKNGRIYGINSSNKLVGINEGSNTLYTAETGPNVVSNDFDWNSAFYITGRYRLPDQIDGENYATITGDVTPSPYFIINAEVPSNDCANPTQVFNCPSAPITLSNWSINATSYRITVGYKSTCINRPTLIHDTGILPTCPSDLKNLPGPGSNGTYLASHTGIYQITLYAYNLCGESVSAYCYLTVANAPSGANSSFKTNVILKPNQTLTIGACSVTAPASPPTGQTITYSDGATSCGSPGGYVFPMEHSSVATPNEVGRLNTSFDLTGVSQGLGSSSYTIYVKTDQWNTSTLSWVSMDSNPLGEATFGGSGAILSLIGLVAYDPLSPWYEAFTNSALTPDGSIYRITITVTNECNSYTTQEIIKLNTNKFKIAQPGAEEVSDVDQSIIDSNLEVYPNPTTGRLIFDYVSTEDAGVKIVITSVDGKVVADHSGRILNGENQVSMNLDHLKAGTYLYNFEIGGKVSSGKIVKQ
ncbi:MAG: T9SS type A sorting domain-containing protein [Fluviicola sp.]